MQAHNASQRPLENFSSSIQFPLNVNLSARLSKVGIRLLVSSYLGTNSFKFPFTARQVVELNNTFSGKRYKQWKQNKIV